MTIKQISVFLENRPGTLADATETLSKGGVNLRALCVADTHDFGILRLIADDHDKALSVLKEAGYATTSTEVLAAVFRTAESPVYFTFVSMTSIVCLHHVSFPVGDGIPRACSSLIIFTTLYPSR